MRKVRLFLPTCFRNVFGMGVSLTTSFVHDIFRKSFPISSQQFRLFLETFLERQTLVLWLHARCNENNHDWCIGICQFMCYCTDINKEYIWFQFDISGICTQTGANLLNNKASSNIISAMWVHLTNNTNTNLLRFQEITAWRSLRNA